MTPDEYQDNIRKFMNHGLSGRETLSNWALGLAGESGEVVEIIKKFLYHGSFMSRYSLKHKTKEEIGDVLFYAAALCAGLDIKLGDAMQANIKKLEKRYPDGFKPGGGER